MVFLFIFLLSVSLAALTVSPDKQEKILKSSWQKLGNQTKNELQVAGNCCGFHVLADLQNTTMYHPPCTKVQKRYKSLKSCYLLHILIRAL